MISSYSPCQPGYRYLCKKNPYLPEIISQKVMKKAGNRIPRVFICTRVQTGYAGGTYPGTNEKTYPPGRVQPYPGTKPGNGLFYGVFRALVCTSLSGTILLRAESTSFTSMGSQVRVLLRPPQSVRKHSFRTDILCIIYKNKLQSSPNREKERGFPLRIPRFS